MIDEQKQEGRELIRRRKQAILCRAESPARFHHPHRHCQKHAKTMAARALSRVIGRGRTYARWVSARGGTQILGRILGLTDPDQHC